ncbi:MAG: hypothetical protein IMX00_04980 [Limnochordales bacterium]|nr:hypothetical protein [Limnochordales bacterium]
MSRRIAGVAWVFGLLLAVTVGGILYHVISGYDYPASPASAFELNVLGDAYEAFFLVPVGLIGLWALYRQKAWGGLLIAGVAANLTYNYAMLVTGRQNPWIFLWTVKLALAGTAVCLVWGLLPSGPGRPTRTGTAVTVYLAVILVVMGAMMARRLLASATGRTLDMAMQAAGALDWGEPYLRDPIVFLSLAAPVMVAAILGLGRGTDWGGRAASLASVFIVSIVTVILFTGPLKEYLQTGSVSPGMWGMSVFMLLVAAPATWSAVWLARSGARQPTRPADASSQGWS